MPRFNMDGWTDRRMDRQTDRQTGDSSITPPFVAGRGIITGHSLYQQHTEPLVTYPRRLKRFLGAYLMSVQVEEMILLGSNQLFLSEPDASKMMLAFSTPWLNTATLTCIRNRSNKHLLDSLIPQVDSWGFDLD